MTRIDPELLAFLDVLTEFELSESNGRFQQRVYDRLASFRELTGKHINEITIGELRAIIQFARQEFNEQEQRRCA